MVSRLETWAKDHPFALAFIVLIVGTAISAIPVGVIAYVHGRDDGVAVTETKWQKKFETAVEDRVKEELPKAFKKEIDASDAIIKSKDGEIESLKKDKADLAARMDRMIEEEGRKAAIYELYNNLVQSAKNIRANMDKARRSRESRFLARERESFSALLTLIHDAHEKGGRWVRLFDDQASNLYDRLRNNKPISVEEIIAFLGAFVEDPEAKLAIVDALAQVASQAQSIKD